MYAIGTALVIGIVAQNVASLVRNLEAHAQRGPHRGRIDLKSISLKINSQRRARVERFLEGRNDFDVADDELGEAVGSSHQEAQILGKNDRAQGHLDVAVARVGEIDPEIRETSFLPVLVADQQL